MEPGRFIEDSCMHVQPGVGDKLVTGCCTDGGSSHTDWSFIDGVMKPLSDKTRTQKHVSE